MQFKSPFHIIHPDIKYSQIRFERKKIIAQLELSDNQSIESNGEEYTKSEMLSLLEELEDERIFGFHKEIYQAPALLDFLEQGKINKSFVEEEHNNFFKLEGFVDFVSPYFAAQFSKILLKAFHSEEYNTIVRLNEIPFLCSDAYYDSCYSKTSYAYSDLCKSLAKEVKQVKKNQNPFLIRQNYFEREQLINTINALPDYFATLRDKYARLLLETVVECYNLRNRGLAMKIIVQVKRLKCSAETQAIVDDYYGQIKKQESVKLSQLENGDNNDNKGCLWIFIAILIGVLIPVITVSIISNKNKIPTKYKNIHHLDTLISSHYVEKDDSLFCNHRNLYYPKIIDSILQAEKQKQEENDFYELFRRNSKVHQTFGSYFNKTLFLASRYYFKNFRNYFVAINNTSYDATFFIVNNQEVLTDIHLYANDTLYLTLYDKSIKSDKEYSIWLYVGNELNIASQFTIENKKIGYGYMRQPLNYKGVFNSNQKFQFSSESIQQDSLYIRKHINFSFELNLAEDEIILQKDSIFRYDTSIIHAQYKVQ